jgi:hypothetical protein
LYWPILSNTHHGVHPLLRCVIMSSHATLCTHPVQSIQENVISTHAKACFGLEVSYQWKLSASAWNLIKISSIRQRGWTDGRNIDGSLQVLWETKNEKLHERPSSFPPFDCCDILFSPQSMHLSSFLVLPTSFHKSWDEISFKGGGL